MQKLRYTVDPHNRLVITESGKKSDLTRFRRVIAGKFKTGPGNSLTYQIKAPMTGLAPNQGSAPHQVKFRGKWSLTKNYDLKLTLDKWRRQSFGDELTLSGQIVAASANSISFSLTTRSKKGLAAKNILKLEGRWQADKYNRLTFRVKKAQGKHDVLTFDGIWEIGKNNRIVYRYKKAQLTTKRTFKKTLIFEGSWDITKRNRLAYNLTVNKKSGFDFKTGVGFLNKGYIKYELSIGVSSRKQPLRRSVTLYGKWKIKRNIGLLFEIEYEKGKIKAIVFGADFKLTKANEIRFRLKNELNKDLGLELKLSRKLLKGDGESFFKILKSKKEVSVYAGSGWRW